MRPLLLILLTTFFLSLVLPLWVKSYVASQIWYVLSFRFLSEVSLVVNVFEWIPKQCNWTGGLFQLAFMHFFVFGVWFANAKGWTDKLLRGVALVTSIHCGLYFGDLITHYCMCDTKRLREGTCASIIFDGVNSVSLFEWWVDGMVIHWVSVVFVVMEGWRVRMDLIKVLLYAVFCSGFTQITALPLFLIDYRKLKRVNDVMWTLKFGTAQSSITNRAIRDSKEMASFNPALAEGDDEGGVAAVAPASLEHSRSPVKPARSPLRDQPISPVSELSAVSEEEPESRVRRRRVATASEAGSKRGSKKKKTSTKKKALRISTPGSEMSEDSVTSPTPRHRLRRQESMDIAVHEAAHHAHHASPIVALALPNILDDATKMFNGEDSVLAARIRRTQSGGGHTQEPGSNPGDFVDMPALTKKFWEYGPEGVPADVMEADPSPVPFRKWPILFKHVFETFRLNLSLLLPIFFGVVGIVEIWTWLAWMNVYVEAHCWLSGFFDFAFVSPSSLMMTTGGWYGLPIWGSFMVSTEPSGNPKWFMYMLLMFNFHNVAFIMCLYILWREFRLRYLPAKSEDGGFVGLDKSVWQTSLAPSEYFLKPVDSDSEKHAECIHSYVSGLDQSIRGFFRPIASKAYGLIYDVFAFTGLVFVGKFVFNYLRASHAIVRFVGEAYASIAEAVYLTWLDILSMFAKIGSWIKSLNSNAPLPTPSPRNSVIDWTLFFPYVMVVWALSFNAYVLCWWMEWNSSTRQVLSGTIAVLAAAWLHYRQHDKTRLIWLWLMYETEEEVQLRKAREVLPCQDALVAQDHSLAHRSQVSPPQPEQVLSPRTKQEEEAKALERIAVAKQKQRDAELFYQPFKWNPHVIWTVTYLIMTLFAVFILIPDPQFGLPSWTKIYSDFRQNGVDGIHRGSGESLNVPLLGLSIALLYPLIFGFSLRGPNTRFGMPFTSLLMKILYILPLVVVFGVVWKDATEPCYIPLGLEGPHPSAEVVANMNATISAVIRERAQPPNAFLAPNTVVRPVHPKTHGCVEAEFTTPYTIPAKFRAGIFDSHPFASGGPRKWKAFVRFSNGALQKRAGNGAWVSQPDFVADVRGMSVKLLKVEGEKALNASFLAQYPERFSQDFVTISSNYFFQSDAGSYASFIKAVASPSKWEFLSWLMPGSFSVKEFRAFWGRCMALINAAYMNMDGANVMNPLDINYYSAVPYRLGSDLGTSNDNGRANMAVKYRFKPCTHYHKAGDGYSPSEVIGGAMRKGYSAVKKATDGILGRSPGDPWLESMTLAERERLIAEQNPDNFLRINLQNRLSPHPDSTLPPLKHEEGEMHREEDEVCFDLMVQDQGDACKNQIEDAEKPWKGDWLRVGRLTIPKQTFLSNSQLNFCENLSFNPWHALKVHKPLGQINQMRKIAYLVAADERRRLNGDATKDVLVADYVGDELSKLGSADRNLRGDAASYEYADYSVPYNFMPKHIVNVPFSEQMSNDTHMDIMHKFLTAERSISYPQPKLRLEFSSPQDYQYFMLGAKGEALYNNTNQLVSGRMRRPDHVDGNVWTSDVWWARQFIQGLNPMSIIRVTEKNKLPAALGVFDAKINAAIAAQLVSENTQSLEVLAKEGRLFYVDYEELDDINTFGDRILYSPIVVFYMPASPRSRDLLPLFIQLDRKSHLSSGNRPRLFFPAPIDPRYPENSSNEGLVWLFAKMHVSSADAVTHQMVYHLLECHLAMEPTIIATHRAFSPEHHILRLLKQHFTGTIAINDFGRDTLLSDMHAQLDGFLSTGLQGSLQIMQKHYNRSYHFMETVPAALKRRGFDVDAPRDPRNWGSDSDQLPGFLYRDYGLAIWWTFRSYVHQVLSMQYGADKETQARNFAQDAELKAWFHELRSPSAGAIPNVPDIKNFDQLVDLVTQIMFQGSAQHAAVNFAQFEFQAFQPSRPLYLRRGMPLNLTLVDHHYMLASLMPVDDVILTNSVFDILSACCVNTLMLDLSESDGFINPATTITPAFPTQWETLKVELHKIDLEMRAHNAKIGANYPYLYPSRIPQSIAI